MTGAGAPAGLLVWDLPTRLFHWALAACVVIACASAHAGGEAAQSLHFASGYAALALAVFRVLWGFAGSRYARFAHFLRGPAASWRYATRLLRAPAEAGAAPPGHNPLGAISVLALLAGSGLQAASGLLTDDQVASQGPLAHLVSDAVVARASALHAWGEFALYVLVALHVAAIAFYRLARGRDLLRPMLTGRMSYAPDPAAGAVPARDDARLRVRAALLLAASAALVGYLAYLG